MLLHDHLATFVRAFGKTIDFLNYPWGCNKVSKIPLWIYWNCTLLLRNQIAAMGGMITECLSVLYVALRLFMIHFLNLSHAFSRKVCPRTNHSGDIDFWLICKSESWSYTPLTDWELRPWIWRDFDALESRNWSFWIIWMIYYLLSVENIIL